MKCFCVFHVIITTKNNYFPKHNYPVGLYNDTQFVHCEVETEFLCTKWNMTEKRRAETFVVRRLDSR